MATLMTTVKFTVSPYAKYIIRSILILCIFTSVQLASAEDLLLTAPDSKWTYYQTHKIDTDLSKLKSSDWKVANVPAIFIKDPSNGIYLWYKREFSVAEATLKAFTKESLALHIESIRNSDETWLNGKKIGHIGDISPPWNVWQEYPLNIPRIYKISKELLKPQNNVLLIKINTGIGDISGTEYFGSVGITGHVLIEAEVNAKDQQYQAHLKGNNIDVMIIVLGIIDVILILFLFKNTLHNLPEFRWLILNSILMLAATLMLDVYYLNGLKYPVFGFIRYITVFGIPLVTALYFWSQNKNLSNKLVITLSTLQITAGLIILLPWFPSFLKAIAWKVMLVLVIIFFLYSLYSAIKNLRHKQVGSLSQFIGLMIYFLSIRTDLFNVDLFEHRNVYIGALIFRYGLLFAYFQRIRHMSVCYKTLSKRMLNTIEDKRSEMARELHDGLGQHLASSKFQTQLATVGNHKEHLSNAKEEIDLAVNSMHRLVAGLHPMALDRYRLQEAIRTEAKRLSSTYSIKIKTDLHEQLLPKEIEIHLFRIFQEAVSNAARHGKAKNMKIRLKINTNKLIFSIEDNGMGYKKTNKSSNSKQGGFGLISLNERANLIGASLEQVVRPKEGTKLIIEILL